MLVQLWGLSLFTLGALVIADAFLGFMQQSAGIMRWLYLTLGLLLVTRGLLIMKPFAPKR